MRHSDKTTDGCKLVLIRHEHTEMSGTFCGHLDPPLSERGRAQLKRLTSAMNRYSFDSVYSSDLRRAVETAEAIAAIGGLPVRVRSDLREVAFGEWEGLRWQQIVDRDPEFAQRWVDEYPAVPAPGGEEFGHFLARIQQAQERIAGEVRNQSAAIITHAGVIRTILGSVTQEIGEPIDLSSCAFGSWWEIRRHRRRWILHACSADLPSASARGMVVENHCESTA